MIYRSTVLVAALLIGACSKSDPGSSNTTSAPITPSPTTAPTSAPTTPSQPQGAGPATPAEGHSGQHTMPATPGMPSGMPMQGHPHDAGMGMGMGQPMPHQ